MKTLDRQLNDNKSRSRKDSIRRAAAESSNAFTVKSRKGKSFKSRRESDDIINTIAGGESIGHDSIEDHFARLEDQHKEARGIKLQLEPNTAMVPDSSKRLRKKSEYTSADLSIHD